MSQTDRDWPAMPLKVDALPVSIMDEVLAKLAPIFE